MRSNINDYDNTKDFFQLYDKEIGIAAHLPLNYFNFTGDQNTEGWRKEFQQKTEDIKETKKETIVYSYEEDFSKLKRSLDDRVFKENDKLILSNDASEKPFSIYCHDIDYSGYLKISDLKEKLFDDIPKKHVLVSCLSDKKDYKECARHAFECANDKNLENVCIMINTERTNEEALNFLNLNDETLNSFLRSLWIYFKGGMDDSTKKNIYIWSETILTWDNVKHIDNYDIRKHINLFKEYHPEHFSNVHVPNIRHTNDFNKNKTLIQIFRLKGKIFNLFQGQAEDNHFEKNSFYSLLTTQTPVSEVGNPIPKNAPERYGYFKIRIMNKSNVENENDEEPKISRSKSTSTVHDDDENVGEEVNSKNTDALANYLQKILYLKF